MQIVKGFWPILDNGARWTMRKTISSLMLALIIASYSSMAPASDFCERLASPNGVAITTIVYGSLSAISNFLWCFRWNVHTKMSDEMSAQLQEIGGITVAAEIVLLGVLVPAIAWGYTTKQQAEKKEPKSTFIQFLWGRKPAAGVPPSVPTVIVID